MWLYSVAIKQLATTPPPLTIFAIEHIFMRFMAMNFSDRGNFFSQLWNFQKLSQADGVGVGAILHPPKNLETSI